MWDKSKKEKQTHDPCTYPPTPTNKTVEDTVTKTRKRYVILVDSRRIRELGTDETSG